MEEIAGILADKEPCTKDLDNEENERKGIFNKHIMKGLVMLGYEAG